MPIKSSLQHSIVPRIIHVRGLRVMLDSDLAGLYEVPTKRFNEAVKRNAEKFPSDFMFTLTDEEFAVLRSQSATSKQGSGGRRYAPRAFTEHGALMAATVLSSPRAIEVSVYVVRAFVRLRELTATNSDFAGRLAELESKTEALTKTQDGLSRSTKVQLKVVFDALRSMALQDDAPRRPIGFVHPAEPAEKATPSYSPLNIPKTGLSNFITSLAAEYGVRYEKTFGDAWAESVTRLAGDDVDFDEVDNLIIALERSGKISIDDMVSLLVQYAEERSNV